MAIIEGIDAKKSSEVHQLLNKESSVQNPIELLKTHHTLPLLEGDSHQNNQTIKLSLAQIDMLSGIAAGIVYNIVSHPLDTVKVRMQLGSTETVNLVPTVKSIYHKEGVSLCFDLSTLINLDSRFLQGCPFSNHGPGSNRSNVRL